MRTIEELEEAKKKLLKEKPFLKETQDRIDKILSCTNDPVEKCKILNEMIQQMGILLTDKMNDLTSYLNEADLDAKISDLAEEFRSKKGNNNS